MTGHLSCYRAIYACHHFVSAWILFLGTVLLRTSHITAWHGWLFPCGCWPSSMPWAFVFTPAHGTWWKSLTRFLPSHPDSPEIPLTLPLGRQWSNTAHDLVMQMLRNVTVWLTNHWFRGKQGMDIEVREDWPAFLRSSSSPQRWDKALDLDPFLCPQ